MTATPLAPIGTPSRLSKSLPHWVGGYVPSYFNILNGQNFALDSTATKPPGVGWEKPSNGFTGPCITVTTGQSAPDGTTTASKIIESFEDAGLGRTAIHGVYSPTSTTSAGIGQGYAELDGSQFRLIVIAKAAERTRIVIGVDNGIGVA